MQEFVLLQVFASQELPTAIDICGMQSVTNDANYFFPLGGSTNVNLDSYR
jgi:hypothetical protein